MIGQYLSVIFFLTNCKEVTPVLRHSGSWSFFLFPVWLFTFPVIFSKGQLDICLYNDILDTSEEKTMSKELKFTGIP